MIDLSHPVIIVGAPRSGTSLMQSILREMPGFASMASEANIIWSAYTHPALHSWDCEKVAIESLNTQTRNDILNTFYQQSKPASFWRQWSHLGLMNNPLVASILRKIYQHAGGVIEKIFTINKTNNEGRHRLVEKSVHCGLWLELIEHVFPDARYIYMQRSGFSTIPSMVDGWLDPDRFFTYKVPAPLNIAGYPYQKWNFALPSGWREYTDKHLVDVVAYQWSTIHDALWDGLSNPRQEGRVKDIKLESLVYSPQSVLKEIASHIGTNWNDHWTRLCYQMPVINARESIKPAIDLETESRLQNLAPLIDNIEKRLGYCD